MESESMQTIGGYMLIDLTGAVIAYSKDELACLNALRNLNQGRMTAMVITISQASYQILEDETSHIKCPNNYYQYSDQYYGEL